MMLSKNNSKLGIFVFYDKDNYVDDYVVYMLDSLYEAVEDLIIVSNVELDSSEIKKLQKYTDKIEIRKNIGLDAGAFKYIYDKYKDYFKQFDELILLNDTFYGPFEPFKDIFKKMDSKDLDFWGLTANYDSEDGYGFLPDGKINSHIQTFFIAFRNNVLKSDAFNDYWEKYDIEKLQSFVDVVTKHELFFTNYLESNGFKWDTYVDLEKYKSDKLEGNFNIYAYCAYNLVKYSNCPFVKRKNFVFNKKDALYLNDGSDSIRVLQYIKENDLYDIDLILKNLTRLYSAEELYYGLNMSYIIKESEKKHDNSYAIVLYIEKYKYCDEYLNRFLALNLKNIFIYTKNDQIKEKFSNYNVNVDFENVKKYKYLFVINDFEENSVEIISPYLDLIQEIYEGGLKSKKYINGVIDFFEENKYISLALLPECLHSQYFYNILNENKKLQYLKNACWVKSEIFDKIESYDYVYIDELIQKVNNNNMLFAKIYDEFLASNRLVIYESINNMTYKQIENITHTRFKTVSEIVNNNFSICFMQPRTLKSYLRRAYNKIKRIIKRIIKKIIKL